MRTTGMDRFTITQTIMSKNPKRKDAPAPHADLKPKRERKDPPTTIEDAKEEFTERTFFEGYVESMKADPARCNTDNPTGCWLSLLIPNNKGYVQPTFKSRKMPVLHNVMFTHFHQRAIEEGMQVSHLCHHRNCFNPAHLIEETPTENNARKGCLVWYYCAECAEWKDVCPHTPKCMKAKVLPANVIGAT